jgi:hypothetical protein
MQRLQRAYPTMRSADMANAILRAVLRPAPMPVSLQAAAVWQRPLPANPQPTTDDGQQDEQAGR